jgi:hypothetical protein
MEVMTINECALWFKERGIAIPQNGSFVELFEGPLFSHIKTVKFLLPNDSGRKAALAHLLIRQIENGSNTLIWLQNWDVWQSSGHKPLLDRVRESLGCSMSLSEYPCHLFKAGENDDMISIVILSLEFYWDCLVVTSDLKVILFISHDEYYLVASRDTILLEKVEDIVKRGKWGEKVE